MMNIITRKSDLISLGENKMFLPEWDKMMKYSLKPV